MKSIATLAIIGLALAAKPAGAAAATEAIELLRDPNFQLGFVVLGAKGAGHEIGTIGMTGAALSPATKPAWELAQWHSRFEFTNFAAASGDFSVSNAAKWLRLDRGSSRGVAVTLGVDSRAEYDGRPRRAPSEPWVHLLLQQSIEGAPALSTPGALRLRFETRLRGAETFRPEGYSDALHAAQFQVVLTLNNTRRGSPGFGDYLWFVVPVYDDRHEVPPPYVAQDFAVTQGKLIFNPGAASLATNVVRADGWARFDCDLRPWLERALATAWDKGYLRDSKDRSDYRLAHLNVGWEVPGLNRVAMELRELSLTAVAETGSRTGPTTVGAEEDNRRDR